MPNKGVLYYLSFAVFTASILLTAIMPESRYFHLWYQASVLAVIMLSMYISIKDVFIVVLLVSCAVWGLGFFDIITGFRQLTLETIVIISAAAALGIYEKESKREIAQQDAVVLYKKGELEAVSAKIAVLNRENQSLTDEIKRLRKLFSS